MKRPDATDKGAGDGGKAPTDGFAAKLPVLLSYLVDTTYDDGSTREPSAISIFIEGGQWKAALNDKDVRRSLYVTSATLAGALEALEKAAASPGADWRSWAGGKKKK